MNEKLSKLLNYSACEVADVLLELGVPGAGFLPDLVPITITEKVAAPATTVLFVPKPTSSFPTIGHAAPASGDTTSVDSNISSGSVYADMVNTGTIVVLSQPKGATTATMGGLMAARMNKIGAKGVLVDGRVRDVKQLRELQGMQVWSKATSIVPTSGECKAHAVNVPIYVGAARIEEGDIVFVDPDDTCAVCIPRDKLDLVLETLPKIAAADEVKMERVIGGMTVKDAINGVL